MTDYQEAEVKMMQEIVKFFDDNPELEKNNAILKKHVNLIRQKLKDIKKYKIKQEFDNTGYTENKQIAKENLANLIVNITASICSYANDSGKNELYNEFKTPISKVKIMSDARIVGYSDTTIVAVRKYKTELKPYNVSAEDLANLTNLSEEYSQILLVPAHVKKEKEVATTNIKKLIPESLKILDRSIDQDMVHYKDIEPDLYSEYQNMRKIDDSKTTALSIKGIVTGGDAEVEVLQYVKVTAQPETGKAKKATTTAKGNYQFKGLPEGKCKLTFTLEYYDTLVVDSVVHSDKFTRLDVVMKKTV